MKNKKHSHYFYSYQCFRRTKKAILQDYENALLFDSAVKSGKSVRIISRLATLRAMWYKIGVNVNAQNNSPGKTSPKNLWWAR
jgi:hypothetical protein